MQSFPTSLAMTQFRYQPLDSARSEFRLLYPIQHTEPDASLSDPDPELKTVLTKDNFFVTPDLSMEFELRTVSLDNDFEPVYTALSYVWGNPETSKSITVNGCTFAITENLNIALRHLQYDDIFPAIWIDAICINQKDDDEKNNQIPRMSRIYSCAREVLVWLGPGTSDDHHAVMVLYQFQAWYFENAWNLFFSVWDAALEDLATMSAQANPVVRYSWPHATSRSQTTSRSRYICDHTYDDTSTKGSRNAYFCKTLEVMANAIAAVNAEAPASVKVISDIDHFASWLISSLLVSGWWNRIWVIQEYTSARSRHFQLGSYRLSDFTILLSRQFVRCFGQRPCESNDDLFRISSVGGFPNHLRRYDKYDEDGKFFEILKDTYVFNERKLYCRDMKDRIFALISLAEKDCKSLGIQADYRKTTREVYIDVARRLLRAKELDILSLCYRRKSACLEGSVGPSIPDECRMDLPSWVPDWSVKIVKPHGSFSSRFDTLKRSYWMLSTQCSNHETSQDEVDRCINSIVLAGQLLDEITRVGSVYDGGAKVECDEDSKLDIDPPLTAFERLPSVSADIEAWSNSARHNQKSIFGLLLADIHLTIVWFILFMKLPDLRSLRYFQEVRDPLSLGYRNYREKMIREAVWRVPVRNLEYLTSGELQKATKSSEARYHTSLHLGLSHNHMRNAESLSDEVGKHGLLQSVRFRILLIISEVKARFHMAMAVVYCKSPAHRLARACCILASIFWAIIPVRAPDRWLDDAMNFALLYVVAMLHGPPNRVVQTKRGYIGVAASSSQPGDKICVFRGSRVAHVLRERGNGQGGYTLIGDAFVYQKTSVGYPARLGKDQTSFEIF
jgi:hypothetical protein